MIRIRRFVPAALLVVCLAAPGAASAKLPATSSTKIVPGKSMAGVKLDMTKAAVFKAWGKGACVTGGGYCEWQKRKPTYSGQYERAIVSFVNGKAIQISIEAAFTKSSHKLVLGDLAKWKTSKGIALGSRLSAVPKAYPAAKESRGDARGWNLLLGSGRNVTVTAFGSPGFGPSATKVSSISVGWSNCHFDPSTECPAG